MQNIYKVKRAFVIPFSVLILLLFVLFVLSLSSGQTWEKVILAVLCLCSVAIGVEAAKREILVNEEGLTLKKFFRVKNFTWTEITHLAVVVMKNKAYFLLTTTKGFYFFSNLIENHVALIQFLRDKLGPEKVEVEVANYLEHPTSRLSLIVMSWIAVIAISTIIILKLWLGYTK
jgi:hypothetical protein